MSEYEVLEIIQQLLKKREVTALTIDHNLSQKGKMYVSIDLRERQKEETKNVK
jgi:hypothetical protein